MKKVLATGNLDTNNHFFCSDLTNELFELCRDAKNEQDFDDLRKDICEKIEQGVDINAYNSEGDTLLLLFISSLSLKAVEFLIENGANPNYPNKNGITPFQMALKKLSFNNNDSSIKMIKILIKNGAEVTPDLNGSWGLFEKNNAFKVSEFSKFTLKGVHSYRLASLYNFLFTIESIECTKEQQIQRDELSSFLKSEGLVITFLRSLLNIIASNRLSIPIYSLIFDRLAIGQLGRVHNEFNLSYDQREMFKSVFSTVLNMLGDDFKCDKVKVCYYSSTSYIDPYSDNSFTDLRIEYFSSLTSVIDFQKLNDVTQERYLKCIDTIFDKLQLFVQYCHYFKFKSEHCYSSLKMNSANDLCRLTFNAARGESAQDVSDQLSQLMSSINGQVDQTFNSDNCLESISFTCHDVMIDDLQSVLSSKEFLKHRQKPELIRQLKYAVSMGNRYNLISVIDGLNRYQIDINKITPPILFYGVGSASVVGDFSISSLDVIQLLIDNGAKTGVKYESRSRGVSDLFTEACKYSSFDIVEYLHFLIPNQNLNQIGFQNEQLLDAVFRVLKETLSGIFLEFKRYDMRMKIFEHLIKLGAVMECGAQMRTKLNEIKTTQNVDSEFQDDFYFRIDALIRICDYIPYISDCIDDLSLMMVNSIKLAMVLKPVVGESSEDDLICHKLKELMPEPLKSTEIPDNVLTFIKNQIKSRYAFYHKNGHHFEFQPKYYGNPSDNQDFQKKVLGVFLDYCK